MDAILLDKRTAAGLLSISLRTVETLISNGQLPVRRIGCRTLIPRAELERFARRDHSIRSVKNTDDLETHLPALQSDALAGNKL